MIVKERPKVAVYGLWHLGSVASACLADAGFEVAGIDPDLKTVTGLRNGEPPLYEPGLSEMLVKNLAAGNLTFTTEPGTAVTGAKYLVIAFDTPVNERDESDLSPILLAIKESIPFLEGGCTVVVRSQVPVGSCEGFSTIISEKRPAMRFGVAYVPENLRLGEAIDRFVHPDMIVIGGGTPETFQETRKLFEWTGAHIIEMDLKSAEMTKHALNSYLAMQISFINEIANLSELVGADAVKVGEALRLDKRVGPHALLKPGLGFGGGTLARDLKTLKGIAKQKEYHTHMIDAVLAVNEQQNRSVVSKVSKFYGTLKGLRFAVYGLTYKANTSTLRRSISLEVIHHLVASGADVRAYDPKADLTELHGSLEFTFCHDPYEAVDGADGAVFMTNWPEFHLLDFSRIRAVMRRPIVFDPQNTLDSDRLVQLGYVYVGTGRTKVGAKESNT